MPGEKKNRRAWMYGSGALISTLFFLGILVFVALIAERHPWRLDLTESGKYTLSQQTRHILDGLEKPVEVKAFFQTASPEEAKAKDLLDTYRYYSDKIQYELIDPDRRPEVARKYEVRSYGTLVVEGTDRRQSIQTADEQSLTHALLKLSRKEEKKLYFLVGHGERPGAEAQEGYGQARSALERENYTVADLNLIQQDRVPDDAAAVIVAGPKKTLFPQEIDSLKAYVRRGGRLMVLLDPYQDGGLREALKGYGIELADDIVIDKLSRVFGGSYLMPMVMQYGPHRITESFEVATFYPEARSVRPADNPEQPLDGVHVEVLASTSENAWGETNQEVLNQGQASFEEGQDLAGPVPMVVLAEVQADRAAPEGPKEGAKEAHRDPGRKGFVLVAGDSDFIDNTHFELSGNGDFFLNMINFLAEEEALITIDRADKSGNLLLLSQDQAGMLFWVSLVLVPLVVLLSGLAAYRIRRAHR